MPGTLGTPAMSATQTAGGIFLPDAATQKVNEGEVVSVGPGARNTAGDLIPMSLAAGDKVLLPEYGGNTVKVKVPILHPQLPYPQPLPKPPLAPAAPFASFQPHAVTPSTAPSPPSPPSLTCILARVDGRRGVQPVQGS